jgi:hypothetical protein
MNRVSFALRGTGRGSLTGRGFTPDLVTGHGSQSVTGADHPGSPPKRKSLRVSNRRVSSRHPRPSRAKRGRSLRRGQHRGRPEPESDPHQAPQARRHPIPVQGYTAGLRYSLAHRPVGGRHRPQRGQPPADDPVLYPLLSRLANAPLAEQGCSRPARDATAGLWHDRPSPTRRRFAPPLRTSRRLTVAIGTIYSWPHSL